MNDNQSAKFQDLGHYAQWFFWLFFTIGIFMVAGGVGMIIAQSCGK